MKTISSKSWKPLAIKGNDSLGSFKLKNEAFEIKKWSLCRDYPEGRMTTKRTLNDKKFTNLFKDARGQCQILQNHNLFPKNSLKSTASFFSVMFFHYCDVWLVIRMSLMWSSDGTLYKLYSNSFDREGEHLFCCNCARRL